MRFIIQQLKNESQLALALLKQIPMEQRPLMESVCSRIQLLTNQLQEPMVSMPHYATRILQDESAHGMRMVGVPAARTTPMAVLGMRATLVNKLLDHGIVTVEDLLSCSREDLARLPEMDEDTLHEIETNLTTRRLRLRSAPQGVDVVFQAQPGRGVQRDFSDVACSGDLVAAGTAAELARLQNPADGNPAPAPEKRKRRVGKKSPVRVRSNAPGESRTPEYRAWRNVINQRTQDKLKSAGIRTPVERAWKTDFQQFIADVGYQPTKDAVLRRIDSKSGWTLLNTIWHVKDKGFVEGSPTRKPHSRSLLTVAKGRSKKAKAE